MKDLVLGCSPITATIYAGKLNKAKTMWAGAKQDVTDQCLDAVAEYLMTHPTKFIYKNKDGKDVVLKLVELEAER